MKSPKESDFGGDLMNFVLKLRGLEGGGGWTLRERGYQFCFEIEGRWI